MNWKEILKQNMKSYPKNILYDDIEYELIHVDDKAIEYDKNGDPMGTYVPKEADENLDEQVVYLDLPDAKRHMMLLLNKEEMQERLQ
tara:strand:+ start:446 stop:706 length:261 start_codon:yes stop_codon:yes gene_type:complete